jgi:hypothetical protein
VCDVVAHCVVALAIVRTPGPAGAPALHGWDGRHPDGSVHLAHLPLDVSVPCLTMTARGMPYRPLLTRTVRRAGARIGDERGLVPPDRRAEGVAAVQPRLLVGAAAAEAGLPAVERTIARHGDDRVPTTLTRSASVGEWFATRSPGRRCRSTWPAGR